MWRPSKCRIYGHISAKVSACQVDTFCYDAVYTMMKDDEWHTEMSNCVTAFKFALTTISNSLVLGVTSLMLPSFSPLDSGSKTYPRVAVDP
jgi:hypothetical protein